MGTVEHDPTRGESRATVERTSERELVVRRVVRGPARLVFEAWTRPELLTPPTRLVWTNEEGDEGGAVTTVTFEEQDGRTLVLVHDLYPSAAALDEAIASGSTEGMPEQLEQLDALVRALPGGV